MTLAAPFLLIVGLGFVTGRLLGQHRGHRGHIGVVLVNQDEGELGESLVSVFQSADLAELVSPTLFPDATAAARSQVDADKAAAAVIIPPGFTASIIPAVGRPDRPGPAFPSSSTPTRPVRPARA